MDKVLILMWLWFLASGETTTIIKMARGKFAINANTIYYPVSGKGTGAANRLFAMVPADTVKSCSECHEDKLNEETVHAPAKKDCQRCHIANGAEHPLDNVVGFALKENVPTLCYECHDPKNEKEFVHDPAQKGDCLKCHDIHTSPNLYLVKTDPVGGLCLDCHDLEIPKGNLVHGAVEEGTCTGCHNPHQANNEALLNTTKLDRLCRKCHKPIRKEFKKEFVHDPFKKKDCFACHQPHSSKEAHLSDMKTQDLCFSCHEDTHNSIAAANVVHGAVNETNTCLNCHKPHASAEKKILFANEKEVCLSCHDKAIEAVSGNIEAISPHLKEGNTVHGPIALGECAVCHKPHASQEHTLLTLSFPDDQYVVADPVNFGLCFDCHDDQLFASPTTESATNFRNGEQNLHYLHVQGNRGRNCNLCHDMHGSENKYLIKKKTRYGNWNMPIEFELTDKGGSCLTGCHERYSYERLVLQDSVNLVNPQKN